MEPFNMLEIPIKAIIDIIAYGMILLEFGDLIDNPLLFLDVCFISNS
jgi:hypothetical protein